jgi:hypothetical protein
MRGALAYQEVNDRWLTTIDPADADQCAGKIAWRSRLNIYLRSRTTGTHDQRCDGIAGLSATWPRSK